ncbi:GFA family protein [Hyphomicrobium sp.]|uniref:GFA family protein n=1 Tax=Hyphomicrobium sp. TaxID=82 RepID=UPI003F717D27
MAKEGDAALVGRCLCGAVSFSVTAKREVDVCHCSMCRRWSAGPFIGFGYDGDVRFEGAEHIGVYRSSEWAERAFCKICGSSLYYHLLGTQHYSFAAGLLDPREEMVLTQEIFIDEKPAYYDLANDVPKLTGQQAFAAFETEKDPNG